MRRFVDREDAGRQLAKALGRYAGKDPLVLGVPRGGVPGPDGNGGRCISPARAGSAARNVEVSTRQPDTLAAHADEVVCLQTPENFGAVGEYYRTFAQVSDDEVLSWLHVDRSIHPVPDTRTTGH